MLRVIKLWWWQWQAKHLRGELDAIRHYWPYMNPNQRTLAKADRKQICRELAAAETHIEELSR